MEARHPKEGQDHGMLHLVLHTSPLISSYATQRKVKFPTEFDALDLATDELREKLLPVSRRLKEVEKERSERRKVRKRTKGAPSGSAITSATTATTATVDVEMGDTSGVMPVDASVPAGGVEEKGKPLAGGELEDESVYRTQELAELEALVSEDVRGDVGCSVSGLYDLVGTCSFPSTNIPPADLVNGTAIVTHKGAAADAGHYIGFVKKNVFHATKSSSTDAAGPSVPGSMNISAPSGGAVVGIDEDDEDWYKFDDDKVSVFPKEKLGTLDGGGGCFPWSTYLC
jgi:ubiquitin carboxyl-terminal hydrolase 14